MAREALDQYRANVFNKYETSINQHLNTLNAGFRLSSVASVNNRGGSSCTYDVLINNVPIAITADTGPTFRNTLSAGDRNTLALAFFFASLDQDPLLSQRIIVIDDPMTSLDEHRTLATIHKIRALLEKVRQVIVLSHSKSFLCQIWEDSDKSNRSAMKIARDGQSSSIEPWDVNQDCVTEHDKRHALIQEYIATGHSNKSRECATALRYILEAFIRVAYPSYFPPGTLLGHFHDRCESSLQKSTPILNEADTAELGCLKDYANKFHHHSDQPYTQSTINDQELNDYCRRTLKFAQRA